MRVLQAVLLAVLGLCGFYGTASAADRVQWYDDPRVQAWTAAYHKRDYQTVIAGAEQDLRSGAPHPSAAYVWSSAHYARGTLDEAIAGLANHPLNAALGHMPEVFLLAEQSRHQKILDLIPADAEGAVNDPWVLRKLCYAATQRSNIDRMKALTLRLIRTWPDNFNGVWCPMALANTYSVQKWVQGLAGQNIVPADSPAGAFLTEIAASPNIGQLARRAAVDAFLQRAPQDARAIRYRGHKLSDLYRYDAALAQYDKAHQLFPMWIGNWSSRAKMLLRLERFDEAERVVKTSVPVQRQPESGREIAGAAAWAGALINAGERGRAQVVLSAALASAPDHGDLNRHMTNFADGDEAKLAHWRKAHQAEPEDAYVLYRLALQYRLSDRPADGLAVINAARQGKQALTGDVYNELANILNAMDQPTAAIEALQDGMASLPGNSWLYRLAAGLLDEQKNTAEMARYDEESFQLHKPLDYQLKRMQRRLADQPGALEGELEKLRQRFPDVRSVWLLDPGRNTKGLSGADLKTQYDLMERAIAANPGQNWPYDFAGSIAYNARDFVREWEFSERALLATENAAVDERAAAILNYAEVISWARSMPRDRRARSVRRALSLLAQAEQLGADHHDILQYRYRLNSAIGNGPAAAKAAVAYYRLDPDAQNRTKFLFSGLVNRELENREQFVALHRWFNRNPYDPRRLSDIAHFHAKWGGSALVALYYYDLMKTRAPDQYAKESNRVDGALAALGAYQYHYIRRYHEASSVAPSTRYIDWFSAARANAQNRPAHIEKLDLANQRAILLRDGREIEVQDDLISGRPLFTRTGAAWLRMTYDPRWHRLQTLTDSAGNKIILTYDDKGRIIRMSGTTDKPLALEYNDLGKPVLITVEGVGSISVAYNAAGEIQKVSSPEGHRTSLAVTQAFQRLLGMVKKTARRGDLSRTPELPYTDTELGRLREVARKAPEGPESVKARLQVGRYLMANLQARQSYAGEAEKVLRRLFADFSRYRGHQGLVLAAAQALDMLHELTLSTYPRGVDPDRFRYWGEAGVWLAGARPTDEETRMAVLALQKKLRAQPVQLAPSERWLPKSTLSNQGFWRRHLVDDLLPAALRDGTVSNDILARQNGDIVVATSKGLSIYTRGFWTWMGVEPKTGRLNASAEPLGQKSMADVRVLAETGDGALWLGTSGGLIRVAGDYQTGETRFWRSRDDGLQSPHVQHLAALKTDVVVVTSQGIGTFGPEGRRDKSAHDQLSDDIGRVTAIRVADPGKAAVLIGGEGGVFAMQENQHWRLTAEKVDDLTLDPASGEILVLRNHNLFRLPGDPLKKGLKTPVAVQGQQDIRYANVIAGFQDLQVGRGQYGLGVLTDQGISIFHRQHFEHLKLPLTDRVPATLAASRAGDTLAVLTSEGIWQYEGQRIYRDTGGKVRAIVSDNQNGLTYIARKNGLYLSQSDGRATPELVRFDRIRPDALTLDGSGRLYANDGKTILRYAPGNPQPKVLFSVKPTLPEDRSSGKVSRILVARDGTVWVTVGPALFRWHENDAADPGEAFPPAEEFSIFVDPQRFPARSDMIYSVQETVDGRIWVSASNEGHRIWRGDSMKGGLLEWQGGSFRRIEDIYDNRYWFMSSYTPVDDKSAIVGSVGGFTRHRAGRGLESFYHRKDASYLALRKQKTKMLFLATPGVDIGEKTFLFGVAGGVVGWREGQWFYPDRLNWLLPDDHLSGYGSRVVHALSTDRQGRIYAGTDRGLLIYDPGGQAAADFLFANGLGQMAFQHRDQQRMGEISDVMLQRFGKGTAEGKLVRKLNSSRAKVDALKTEIALSDSALAKPPEATIEQDRAKADNADQENKVDLAKLRKKLKKREKAHLRLLANIEKNHRSLYQMLELKPLDLVGLRRKLPADDVVVQYLPTDKRLFIHVVTRDQGTRIRQVKVSAEELFRRAARVAENMPGRERLADRTGDGDKGISDLAKVAKAAASAVPLEEDLAWLYEHLLRPVEIDLADRQNVFIVPVSSLSYVPFSALIRQKAVTDGAQPEYAVQKYRLGYLPTLYILDLVLGHEPSIAESSLVFGNPDGTLPGAEVEAAAIADILEDEAEIMIGEDATYDVLMDQGPDSRVIHLATHAVLDGRRPERSHLVLSGGTRLSVVDAALLDLNSTDLVVLSACESGVGAAGMEYATLARAFAHAGANTIIATLWKIDDKATVEMMKHFYNGLSNDKGVYAALADAQRAMIGKVPVRDWAAFVPMGRP